MSEKLTTDLDLSSLLSDDARAVRPSPIRQMTKLTLKSGLISFAGGMPNPETFPRREISEFAQRILAEEGDNALQYGLSQGYTKLLEILCEVMQERGVHNVRPSQVISTNGSQQGLDMMGRLFVNPGDIVLFELPSYIGAISAFRNLQAELVGVRQDEGGLVTEALRETLQRLRARGRHAKLLYLNPNFQNPSGSTLALDRRAQILELAEEFNFLIFEDDPYSEIYFPEVDPRTLRSLKSIDETGRVIYFSTFSKLLAPGLRSAWIVATDAILNQAELLKQAMDICVSSLDQRITYRCIREGVLARQIPNIREFYAVKRDAMLRALDQYFPGSARWNRPGGGLFLWVALPESLNAATLLDYALEKLNVSFVVGQPFHVDHSGPNTLRLAFSKEKEDRIAEGIRRLGEGIRALCP